MIWKDIEGYSGLYQVSNTGLVRSLDHIVAQRSRHGTTMLRKYAGKVLKPRVNKQGYYYIHLSKDGVKETSKIHRLVAKAFVKGFKDGLVVNHKDTNKLNNFADNLEWCTVKENVRHGVSAGVSACLKTGEDSNSSLYIYTATKLDGTKTVDLIGLKEIIQNGFTGYGVWACCTDKQKHHKGYTFTRRLKNESH